MPAGVECVAQIGATLGEGPVWFDDALWFVDIKAPAIHRFDPATARVDRWTAPDQVGWVLPGIDGDLLAGLRKGISRFDDRTGTFHPLVEIEADRPGNRLNDAVVDSAGRLSFGTMDDAEEHATGAIYRADANGIARVIDGVTITNGPAISKDGRTLYHNDTLAGLIMATRLAPDGTLGGTSVLVRVDPADGYPDGPTIDAEGCLWVGLFGGWGVRRYAPDGTLLRTMRFPVANVTKIAFGGSDHRTAFATTARKGVADLSAQPDAGGLFAFDPGVAGLPCRRIGSSLSGIANTE